MLYLASSRGLQVIVLTCNPADYVSLGAKTITLRPVRFTAAAPNAQIQGSAARVPDTAVADSSELPPPGVASVLVTEELRQKLLLTLTALGGSKGNQALREELGWDEDTYVTVKDDLVANGKLSPGRGRGGSVSLPGA